MLHKMRLEHKPFMQIKERTKTVEMRLNDEKRSKLRVGDVIEFTDLSDGAKMNCAVKNLFKYPSFYELYKNHGSQSIGYGEGEAADPADMYDYYSQENIEKYGVVGIEVEALNAE